LAVGTPPRPNGEADLAAVEEAARAIGGHVDDSKVIVTKSIVTKSTVSTGRPFVESFGLACHGI